MMQSKITEFFKLLFILFTLTVVTSVFAQDSNDGLWDDRFGAPGITCCVGFSFDIYTAETGPDGIYVGGTFQQLGEQYGTRGIARWDGRRWHSLDGGLFDTETLGGDVYDIAIDGDNVYVVGDFHSASGKQMFGIARWHIPSQEWFPVGSGKGPEESTIFDDYESVPRAVAVVDGDVYIGGSFDEVDDLFVRRAARWNGSSWSSLGNGLYMGDSGNEAVVRAIAGVNGLVYVGGEIDEVFNRDHLAENVVVNHLAVYDPATDIWSDVGGGTSARVRTLTAHEDALYVGGGFFRAGGNTVNGIAKWQNNQWSALDTGVDGWVDSIKVLGDDVYVGGGFYDASGVADTDSLARWDGSQWHSMGTSDFFFNPAENYISALGVFPDGRVLVGGEFGEYAPRLFEHIAFWNGTNWQGSGLGFEDGSTTFVGADGYAVAVAPNGHVFVGGDFEHISGLPYSHIAMWDGNRWNDLAGGVNGDISSLILRGDYLYVGGGFATVGNNIQSARVARWHIPSQTWSAVGSGFPGGYVSTMAFVGDTLFVGGSGFAFDDECCLLKWNPDENGGAWQAFSEAFVTDRYVSSICCRETAVRAMASDDEVLMVGGVWVDVERRIGRDQVTDGDLFLYHPATDSIADFGTGIDGSSLVSINEIAITHSGVYIGGEFSSINGLLASNIARLTADGWSSLNVVVAGDDPLVTSVVQNGNELYMAGSFDEVGGIPAYNVARLDLTTNRWSALGCGITRTGETVRTDSVRALAVQPEGLPNAGLFATGGIARAGCAPSVGFAAWYGVGADNSSAQGQPRFPFDVFGANPTAGTERLFLPMIRK